MRQVRALVATSILGSTLFFCSCLGSGESQSEREKNANTAAGKVGRAAHSVAKEAGKAASVAGRQLAEAARQAHDGWVEAGKKDQQKKGK